MLFNSLHFILFFPVVVAFYFLTPPRQRPALLLASSYYFYASWSLGYLGLLIVSTAVDYAAGIRIAASRNAGERKAYLAVSLVANLGFLFFFKYLGFAAEVVESLAASLGVGLDARIPALLLPVGISFYTFQTLSYSIDVYRGRILPERSFTRFALYVSFFPQLVAGPIERAGRLLPQFDVAHRFDRSRILSGLTLAAWGFFQKLVIADRLAPYVTQVYDDPAGQPAGAVLVASYLFAFQLYADFSGYTDIARGTARVLGIELMRNFRRPYFATSVADFWSRWHISLTTWFRDYLYAALRGDRRGRRGDWLWVRNVMLVFLATGLWHGAAWTFVVAGLLHGLYMTAGPALAPVRNAIWSGLENHAGARAAVVIRWIRPWTARVLTFHLVTLAFLFMRARSLSDAMTLLTSLGNGLLSVIPRSGPGAFELFVAAASVAVLVGMNVLERHAPLEVMLQRAPRWMRWGAFYGLFFGALICGEMGVEAFYYFQF